MAAMRPALLAGLAACVLLAGCGSGTGASGTPAATVARAPAPALVRARRGPGEVVVRGDTTPKTAGPYAFHGAYRVRFQQYAPEDPRLDFRGETAFVADLERTQGIPARRLFRAAAARGSRTVRLNGRFYVDASFGDYPFVLRFTPVRG